MAERQHPITFRSALMFTVRYLIPAIVIAFGLIWWLAGLPYGWEAFCLFAGAGVSSALLNGLYRFGVSGDADRDAEERARDYFSEHGHWPDERPGSPS